MIGSLEKKILIDLFKASNGLQDQTISQRFSLSISKTLSFIDKYEKLEWIKYDGINVEITDSGRQYLLGQKIISVKSKPEYKIPNWIIGEKISINDFYTPNLKYLDLEELKNFEN